MYVSRIPMPEQSLEGPRQGPGSSRKGGSTSSPVLSNAVISHRFGSTDGLIGKKQNLRSCPLLAEKWEKPYSVVAMSMLK
jgi:hypothetical protein